MEYTCTNTGNFWSWDATSPVLEYNKHPTSDIVICPDAVSNIRVEILNMDSIADKYNTFTVSFFYHVGLVNSDSSDKTVIEPIRLYLRQESPQTFVLDYFTDSNPYLVCAIHQSHLAGIEFSSPIEFKITCHLHYYDFPKRLYLQTHRQVFPLESQDEKLGSVHYENGHLYFLCTSDKAFLKPPSKN